MNCECISEGSWKKIKKGDISRVEDMLFNKENDYVSACAKFLKCEKTKDPVWILYGKDSEILSVIIYSRSTLIPVLFGLKEIPFISFIKGFMQIKKIHSVQGIKNEVIVLEDHIKKTGLKTTDIIDYDLMKLDTSPDIKKHKIIPDNLVLRTPKLTDLDAIAPLQAAYEQEEVLPKGSTFSPAASRINITNIIANGRILAAQIDGKIIGKINVSAVSFTRYMIGGVYVHPDYRGTGIASRMASEFISSLINEGKGITLFVKKSNVAACRLYTGLGFKICGDYRITYY